MVPYFITMGKSEKSLFKSRIKDLWAFGALIQKMYSLLERMVLFFIMMEYSGHNNEAVRTTGLEVYGVLMRIISMLWVITVLSSIIMVKIGQNRKVALIIFY